MSVCIILTRDPQKKHLGDCNESYNNGQMCSAYAVKFKFTNAKQEIVS